MIFDRGPDPPELLTKWMSRGQLGGTQVSRGNRNPNAGRNYQGSVHCLKGFPERIIGVEGSVRRIEKDGGLVGKGRKANQPVQSILDNAGYAMSILGTGYNNGIRCGHLLKQLLDRRRRRRF